MRVKTSPVENVKNVIACATLIIVGLALLGVAYLFLDFTWTGVGQALDWRKLNWPR